MLLRQITRKLFGLMGLPMFSAKILTDSINVCGNRLTTFELTYPRFIHSELMTHRMLSRNAASSRAIPARKMIERVLFDPVIPIWWGKAESGMQAREEIDEHSKDLAIAAWLTARDNALETVNQLMNYQLHKQIPNRLLEPWMWITSIFSATDWWHFFNLRVHPDAEPHFQKIAGMALELYEANTPTLLQPGEWHLPLIYAQDHDEYNRDYLAYVSAGRCARVSYLTHEGKRDLKADYDLAEKLSTNKPMHASPLEHPAVAMNEPRRVGNYTGWFQLRKMQPGEYSNVSMQREHQLQS